MIVRAADFIDIPQLLDGAREFVEESAYGWVFDEKISQHTMVDHIMNPGMDVLVVETEGELAGAALVVYTTDFVSQRLGYVEKFFIRSRWRGSPAGRLLVVEMTEWFQKNQCWSVFATATANLGAAKTNQFRNLMSKFGYEPCGDTMMKDLANG